MPYHQKHAQGSGRVSFLLAGVVFLVIFIGYIAVTRGSSNETPQHLYEPSLDSATSSPQNMLPSATPVPTLRASTASPTPSDIAEAKPTELQIPAVDLSLTVLPDECPVNAEHEVVPSLADGEVEHPCYSTYGSIWQGGEASYDYGVFALPGSDSAGLATLYAHTGRGAFSGLDDAPFNRLYDGLAPFDTSNPEENFRVVVGDRVLVRTEASADAWLVYQVTNLYAPPKSEFGSLPFWQADTPGLLVLVGCLQEPEQNYSSRNVVVTATYIGLETGGN